MSDVDDLFELYREECVPAYADLVGYIGDKPRQFLTEFENAFAHVAQCFNPDLDPEHKRANIAKAKDHLQRITLDSYKLIWYQINQDIETFYRNPDKRLFCVNMSQNDLSAEYQRFKKAAQDARVLEVKNIGVDPLHACEGYKEAIKIGKGIQEKMDYDKADSLKLVYGNYSIKRSAVVEVGISFIGGVLATLFVITLL